jgi:heterogeneous nuclear ribonucleoprotein A1/A3
MKERETNRPRGFGFLTFVDSERGTAAAAAEAAISQSHYIDGRQVPRAHHVWLPGKAQCKNRRQPAKAVRLAHLQIDAKPSVPRSESGPSLRSKKIFVGGLAAETDEGA